MTLTQLKYIITVADAGSMNLAARELYISQPSLSQAVKELEKEIGVELFCRSNRGVSITQEGSEFLGYARQVVEQYDLIESRYIDRTNVKKKFGVSMQHYTFAVNAFVEMVKQFGMDEYEFAIRETKTYEVIEEKGKQLLLVHAGLRGFEEKKSLEDYAFPDFLFERIDYSRRYYQDYRKIIVTGHTPTPNIRADAQPLIYRGNGHIAIDCGCVFGGNLAAYCVETEEAVYVKSRRRWGR